jgi:eukaryotic-like serine/threonine-protein kinase
VDADRWARVEGLFHEVVDLAEKEREPHLVHAAPDDPDLWREVLSLVRFASEEGVGPEGAGEGSDFPGLSGPGSPAEGLAPGDRAGPWRIVRELGEGGMGSVHLAERDDGQYRAQAAIKVVRGGQGGDLVRRFRAERQILAGLDHPNVARLLEGGSTPEGRPWLALEYVDGVPLDAFCDGGMLPVEARVGLFLQLCEAVEYAHRKLVVHRDIKPGNVLVTAEGVPKLLDFGIAKLLEPMEGEEGPTATLTHLRVMTPAYASPEQVRGEPVTTATDVYGLGLLLYELLSGTPAQNLTGSSQAEVEREVCTQEPPRPSSRVSPETARARGTSPDRLRRTLAGDLDNIVLTALRKEPDRRYASVAALADDLRRWQEGLPVLARGNPWGYRAGKFVRRRAVPLAAASVAIVAFLVTIGFYTTRLADERDRARVEAERANEVAAFLTGVFRQADPDVAPGTPPSARDLLDRGADQIASLEAAPEVRAGMLQAIGVAYHSLGEPGPARPLLEEAVALRRALADGDPRSIEPLWSALDALGTMMWEMGELGAAETIQLEALEQARQLGSDDRYPEATSLNNLGKVLQSQGRHEEAGELFAQALDGFRAARGPVHASVATALANRAQVLALLGGNEAGEELQREAIEVTRALPAGEQLNLDAHLSNLASTLISQGRLDEAEVVLRDAMAEAEARYGVGSPRTASDLSVLARLHARRGDFAGAEVHLRDALPRLTAWLGPDHPDVAYELSNLGATVARLGRPAEADSLHGEAVALARRTLEADNPLRARALVEYGRFLLAESRHAEAARVLSEALEVARRSLPPDHSFVQGIETSLSDAEGRTGG